MFLLSGYHREGDRLLAGITRPMAFDFALGTCNSIASIRSLATYNLVPVTARSMTQTSAVLSFHRSTADLSRRSQSPPTGLCLVAKLSLQLTH